MSLSSIRKKGYLHKLPVKGIVKKWNKRWFVLHATTVDGIVRLEYFDNDEYEITLIGKRTIPLRDCKGLSPATGTKMHPYVFQFNSTIGHHVLAADTHSEMEEWITAIQDAIQEDRLRNRRRKAQSVILQPGHFPSAMAGTLPVPLSFTEDTATSDKSDTFEPITSGVYRVTLEHNESAQRLRLTGAYNLEITPAKITLIAADSGAEMAVWKYKQLRTYGKAHGKFNFECGRSAETGSGAFIFNTTCAKEIFGVVNRNIKRMRSEMEQKAQQRTSAQRRMPKQGSEPTFTNMEFAGKQRTYPPMKPQPYRKKNEPPTINVGTYRLSRELESPPSYEEIAASDIREVVLTDDETEESGPRYSTVIQEEEEEKVVQNAPVYAVVDKSKKRKYRAAASNGPTAQGQSQAGPFTSAINDPFSPTNDAFGASPTGQAEQSFDNPFQMDPFSSPLSANADSFNIDPFVIPPPLPLDGESVTTDGVFAAFDNLDTSGFDVFDFNPNSNSIPPLPSSTKTPVAVSSIQNPLTTNNNPVGSAGTAGFHVDLTDDRLFETLAELELQEDSRNHSGAGKTQSTANGTLSPPLPPAPTSSLSSASGVSTATGSAGAKGINKRLSQKEFDKIWDGICSTLDLPEDS